jgi:toxin-antitoxin system PIN domain toxin
MILVDANLLLYAEDSEANLHAAARAWWDEQLSGDDPVCLCWTVLTAFVRVGTNPRVYQRPLTIPEAVERVESWLGQPCVRIIHATGRHLEVFGQLLAAGQATANLVPDAHLAALAIEHGCVLCSTDSDFARFPGLTWKNPLA